VVDETAKAVRGVVDAVTDTAEAALPRRRDGRSERWADHRVSRRNELIDAAISAVRRYGASVGMDQIAAAARTSKPVIYRYFADKTDLYRAVGQRVAGDLLRDLADAVRSVPDVRTRLRAGIDAYLRMLEESPSLYSFVVGQAETAGPDFSSSVADLITQELAGILQGAGLDPHRAEPWGTAMVGFIRSAGQWWLGHRDEMTRAELTDYLTSVLWGGAAGLTDGRNTPAVFGSDRGRGRG
jgi:AcrR family transcriptional regulator